ncbi:MAG: hypothetical protein JNM68_13100 [Dinghuibacter sp.]|nr:hypothetical protein [Dinghuibacter sp.]
MATAICLALLHTATAQVRVGIEVGEQYTLLNPSKSLGLNSGGSFVPTAGLSLQIGSGTFDFIMDAPMGKPFYLETGVFLTNFKYQNSNIQVYDIPSGNDLGVVKTHNLSYLQVPINFLRKFKAGKNQVLLGTGFFGAFNVGERITLKTPLPQFNTNNAAIIGTKGANSVVGGVNLKFGVELGKLYTFLYAQRLMTNVFEKGASGTSWKGYIFGARLGYLLR